MLEALRQGRGSRGWAPGRRGWSGRGTRPTPPVGPPGAEPAFPLPATLLRPAGWPGKLPAVAEPLRGPGARHTQPRGARAPPGCRLSRVPGPGSQRLAPQPARGASGGRSPASQRGLPGRSGPAWPAPPGGLQLSGFPRGLSRLLPPPPQARSTRAGAAAARALPRSGDVRPLLDSINGTTTTLFLNF